MSDEDVELLPEQELLELFRRRRPDAPRPYPTPGYPWVPLLFSLAGAGIVINLFWADPRNALTGAGVLLLGLPVYLFWKQPR